MARRLQALSGGQRDLTPLLLQMIDSLERFVGLDLPFLTQERGERVAALKRLMTDPSVSSAERFRRVVEAYLIEGDYGRVFGAERQTLSVDGAEVLVVDHLRAGWSSCWR